jgi:hypothetical protein
MDLTTVASLTKLQGSSYKVPKIVSDSLTVLDFKVTTVAVRKSATGNQLRLTVIFRPNAAFQPIAGQQDALQLNTTWLARHISKNGR